ncbi:MAG TPA: hypothetical protein VJV78_20260 [Polyangiales bacterium]|nr:hypothetical protein [Polyangiales bacterium]
MLLERLTHPSFWLSVLCAMALPLIAHAQGSARALPLRANVDAAALDAEALRVQLERELALPVELATAPEGSHLIIEATSLSAVRVAFVREDSSTVERTLDVSSSGPHAIETVALVAANLMRDEASALLDSLRAVPPPAAAAPVVAAAPAPPPPPPPPAPPPPGCAPSGLVPMDFGFDLLPHVGMSTQLGTTVERKFSLNLFGGLTGAVRGFELGGLLNIDAHSVCGVQIAGVANLVDGPVQGAQFGLIDWAGGRVDGAQFGLIDIAAGTLKGFQAGLIEVASSDITGAQAGLVNVGGGWLDGAQAGLVNVTALRVRGAQLGLANVGAERLIGAQLGLANLAAADVQGTQLGLANVSAGELTGFQAGLVNVASGRVRGAMLGLVNVAEDSDVSIGLVNVMWGAPARLDVWGTDSGLTMVGVDHGSRYIHNIVGMGFTVRDGRPVLAPAFGLGGRAVDSKRWFLDIDAIAYGLFVRDEDNDEWDTAILSQLRIPIGFRITPKIAIFAGPAFNVLVADHEDNTNLLSDFSLYGSFGPYGSDTVKVQMWPGFTLGARFF